MLYRLDSHLSWTKPPVHTYDRGTGLMPIHTEAEGVLGRHLGSEQQQQTTKQQQEHMVGAHGGVGADIMGFPCVIPLISHVR